MGPTGHVVKIKHNLAFWPLYASFVLIYIGVSIRQNSGWRVPMGLRYWKSFAFLLSPRWLWGRRASRGSSAALDLRPFALLEGELSGKTFCMLPLRTDMVRCDVIQQI